MMWIYVIDLKDIGYLIKVLSCVCFYLKYNVCFYFLDFYLKLNFN